MTVLNCISNASELKYMHTHTHARVGSIQNWGKNRLRNILLCNSINSFCQNLPKYSRFIHK